MDDETFLKMFDSGEWPLADFHHRQHIKFAYQYLRQYPFESAMARMREKINAFNAVHWVTDLPTSG